MKSLPSIATLAALLLACGGSDDGASFDVPECADRQVVIEGTIDGNEVGEVREDWNQFSLDDADATQNGRLTITFPTNDRLFLEWSEPIAKDGTASVRGLIDLRDVGGPRYGNCETGGFSGEMFIPDGDMPGGFVLRSLRDSDPFCGNLPIEGEVRGCFAGPPQPVTMAR